ncbi:MAG: hypothetical protein WCD89_10605 [Anaerocolumna sp.]
MKKPKEMNVKVTFTEGWEERFAQAAYNLYTRVENKKTQELKGNGQSEDNLQTA